MESELRLENLEQQRNLNNYTPYHKKLSKSQKRQIGNKKKKHENKPTKPNNTKKTEESVDPHRFEYFDSEPETSVAQSVVASRSDMDALNVSPEALRKATEAKQYTREQLLSLYSPAYQLPLAFTHQPGVTVHGGQQIPVLLERSYDTSLGRFLNTDSVEGFPELPAEVWTLVFEHYGQQSLSLVCKYFFNLCWELVEDAIFPENVTAKKLTATLSKYSPCYLRTLSLGSIGKLTKEHVAKITTFTSLQKLDINGCLLPPQALHTLLRTLTNLTDLNVSFNSFSDKHLQVLSEKLSVKKFALEFCSISDKGLSLLNTQANLQSLCVRDCPISAKGVESLSETIKKQIRTLDISSCNINTPNFLEAFSALTQLNISKNVIAFGPPFDYLTSLGSIRDLNLSETPCSDQLLEEISTKLPDLTSLDLGDATGNLEMNGLLHLHALSSLTCLNLSNIKTANISRFFVNLGTTFPELSELNISGTTVEDAILRELNSAMKLRMVKVESCDRLSNGIKQKIMNKFK